MKPESKGFLQGDVVDGVPTTWIAKNEKGEFSAFQSTPIAAMVLSNECDCELRSNSQNYIRLCPVLNQSDLLQDFDEKKRADVKGKLERNFYTEYFWMPAPSKDADPLVADLSHFFSVALEDFHAALNENKITKIISLSREGFQLLLIKVAWFMLRPAAPDTERKNLQPWTLS